MLLLSRASSEKQGSTWAEKLATTDRSLRSPQVVPWHHIWNWSCHKHKRDVSKMVSNIQLCCCSMRRRSSSMYCKSRWTRSEAIQADFRASGDRLLDPDQQQKRLDLIRNLVDSILQTPQRKELEEELLQYQEKGTEVKARTAELYSEQKKHWPLGGHSWSSTKRFSAMFVKNTVQEKDSRFANVEYFCRNYQQKRRKSWKKQRRTSWFAGAFCSDKPGEEVWHGTSVKQVMNTKSRSFVSEVHWIISKVVHTDGAKTQTIFSACKKTTARTKPW